MVMNRSCAAAAEMSPDQILRRDEPLQILIVDDEPSIRHMLATCLEDLDTCESHQATNAFEGLALLQKVGRIDGVLADINMPGMDGIEFVSRVKKYDRTIVAVMITGYPSMEIIIKAMRVGASDFLAKPFRLDQVRLAIQRLARERSILIENQLLTEEVKAKKALEAMNDRLEKKIREQAILFTISDSLSKIRSTRELYQKIVSLACSLTDAQQACFWVVNQERKRLVLMGATGPYDPSWEEIHMEMSSLPCVRVAREALPILVTASSQGIEVFSHADRAVPARNEQILVPFTIRKEVFGVLAVSSPREGRHLGEEALFLLHLLAERANLTVENLLLYESVALNLHSTLRALVQSLEAKDPYTKEHSQRVTCLAVEIAATMGCSPEEIDSLRFAGHLHDIGKIGIRDQILMKPGGLTHEEYDTIKTHPIIGAEIVSHLGLLPLEKAIIRHHHERWDGKGYPDGLAGTDIPLLSRILAVADSFDAITSVRPYRAPVSEEEAVKEIETQADTQFDPAVVRAFLEHMQKKEKSREYPRRDDQ